MSELTAVAEPIEDIAVSAEAQAPEAAGIAIADLLVEEVSIDGMCGVY
jgi:mycofactocin precursor